ncbi:hypothetical protein [Nocardia sp. NPDC049707]|uniref:hypothetical protein n=1 Tax=Nocardia sp. NPDC049707 TaxID=3154735 RepID=UPI00342653D6
MSARIDRNELVRAAARNNARWCDVVCRSHGIVGVFDAAIWSSSRRTPPLYPDAVTVSPEATAHDILARIDYSAPGASIKDSFACLDLSAAGFHVLFEAQWIYRSADRPAPAATQQPWRPVEDKAELSNWTAAWSRNEQLSGLFQPELLVTESVSVLGSWRGDRLVAGAVVHRSESVIGVSNLFYSGIAAEDAWAECVSTVARLWPGRSVVGYERGEDLTAAVSHGFEPVGVVRVWIASAQTDADGR